MKRKIKVISTLFAITMASSCYSMDEFVGRVVDSGLDKWNPSRVFKAIQEEYPASKPREKVTLDHRLDRGFADGYIQQDKLHELLRHVEIAQEKGYTINPHVKGLIIRYLETKIPAIKGSNTDLQKVLGVIYLLRPEKMASDLQDKSFINNVTDEIVREHLASRTTRSVVSIAEQAIGSLQSHILAMGKRKIQLGPHSQSETRKSLLAIIAQSRKCLTLIEGKSVEELLKDAPGTPPSEHIKEEKTPSTALSSDQISFDLSKSTEDINNNNNDDDDAAKEEN